MSPAIDLFLASNADIVINLVDRTPLRSLRIWLEKRKLRRRIEQFLDLQSRFERLTIESHERERTARELRDVLRAERGRAEDPARIAEIDEVLADGFQPRTDDEMAVELDELRAESKEDSLRAAKDQRWLEERVVELRTANAERRKWRTKSVRRKIRERWHHA